MVAIKWCHRRNNKLWLALCFSGRYSHGKWLHAHTHTHLISAEDGESIYIMEDERIILLIWKLLLFNVRSMVAHASQRQHQLFFRLFWTFATSAPIHSLSSTGTNTHAAGLHSCQMINGLSTEKVHKFSRNYHGRQDPHSIFPVINLVNNALAIFISEHSISFPYTQFFEA